MGFQRLRRPLRRRLWSRRLQRAGVGDENGLRRASKWQVHPNFEDRLQSPVPPDAIGREALIEICEASFRPALASIARLSEARGGSEERRREKRWKRWPL